MVKIVHVKLSVISQSPRAEEPRAMVMLEEPLTCQRISFVLRGRGAEAGQLHPEAHPHH